MKKKERERTFTVWVLGSRALTVMVWMPRNRVLLFMDVKKERKRNNPIVFRKQSYKVSVFMYIVT